MMLSLAAISYIISGFIGAKVTIDVYPSVLNRLNQKSFPFSKGGIK